MRQRGKLRRKLQRVCWWRVLVREKGTRDNAAGKSYGNGISMVLGWGQNPSGEEVSVSLVYALGLRTDQTIFHRTQDVSLSSREISRYSPKYYSYCRALQKLGKNTTHNNDRRRVKNYTNCRRHLCLCRRLWSLPPLTGFHPVWYQMLQKNPSLVLILRVCRVLLIPTWKSSHWHEFPNSEREDSLQRE